METVNVDARQIASLASKIEALEKKIASFKAMSEEKMLKKWMDTQDVLFALQISTRTLQNYRDRGQLPYSQVGQKFFYKPEDVNNLINNKLLVSDKTRIDIFHPNHRYFWR